MEPLSKAPATMEHPSKTPATTEHPSKAPSLVDLVPPVPKSTVPPNPNKPVPEPTPPVTGNLANALAGGDDKLTPSQLWSQEIEDDVAKMLAKVDGEDLKNMVESAREHPEMKSYVEGVRLEIGNDGVWEFGEEDVYEDMLGFAVWVRARASMRKALGLDSPPTPGSNTSAEPETPAPPGPAEPTAPVHPPAAEPKAEPNTAPAVPKAADPKAPDPLAHKAKYQQSLRALRDPNNAIPPDIGLCGGPPAGAAASTPPPTVPPPAAPPATAASTPPPTMPPPAAPPAKPAAPAPHQLSATVDAAAAKAAPPLPTPVSHRSEYMQYLRAARNPRKMPASLVATFTGSKLDLFRLWLERGQDFNACEVEIRRRNTQANIASAKEKYMSRAALIKDGRYRESDIDLLIQQRTKTGEWIPDANFPDREDLRQYRVGNEEVTREVQNRREDTQEVGSTTELTSTEALLLTEDGADFSDRAVPSIHDVLGGGVAERAGDTTAPDPKAKAKAKPKPKAKASVGGAGDGTPKPDKPITPLEKAVLLKKSVFLAFV